jgi:hypothetical protein
MKKISGVAVSASLSAIVVTIVLGLLSADTLSAQSDVSQKTANVLQSKIDAIQAAEKSGNHPRKTIEVSEPELESYVIYELRDRIPAKIESLDVQLTEGAVAADTKLTFGQGATGSTLVDLLIAGTHTFFFKGKLAASSKQGKFELEEVKVDGIPVPNILVETLIAKYVKPEYPEVELNEPFQMPWGIESLVITPGRTTIVY